MITSLTRLVEEATHEVQVARDAINKWTEKLLKDPAYEMSWSGDQFRNAARHKVWSSVLCDCEAVKDKENAMELLVKEYQKTVLRGAMYPERSTSPASNLMAQEMTMMWANVLERLTK